MEVTQEYEAILQGYSGLQQKGTSLPCPRCGKVHIDISSTRKILSKQADIYICLNCSMDEGWRSFTRRPQKELRRWAAISGIATRQKYSKPAGA